MNRLGKYYALAQCGLEMILPMVGGIFLDQWLGTTPIFTIALLVLGFVGGLAHIVILSNQLNKDEEVQKIIPTDPQDKALLRAAQGAVFSGTTMPSGFKVPSDAWYRVEGEALVRQKGLPPGENT